MESVDRLGPYPALEACTQLEPKCAAGHLFGIAAGSVSLRGTPMPELRQPSRWSFLFGLGRGFGAGYSKIKKFDRNAVLTGKGLYLGYWHWRQYVEEQSRVTSRPAVNRGLGIMIWLGSGVDAVTAASIAHSFSTERRPDIWKGLGFAVAFLSDLCDLRSGAAGTLLQAAAPMAQFLVDGVAFGAFERERFQAVDQQLEHICRQVANQSAAALARASQDRFSDWE